MFVIGEHYHIYNRGAHKAPIFLDKGDYKRFVALLYLANDSKPMISKWSRFNIWLLPRETLVEIFAYCLMPNHFHIGIFEKQNDGVEKFVHKLCTSYGMYYNRKYDHSGTIFQGNYKSKHVDNDDYLRYLIEYIHLNPFGIEEPELMKNAKADYNEQAVEYSRKYDFSSYKDYLGEYREEKAILTFRG